MANGKEDNIQMPTKLTILDWCLSLTLFICVAYSAFCFIVLYPAIIPMIKWNLGISVGKSISVS